MTKPNYLLTVTILILLFSCNWIETQYSSINSLRFPKIIERSINEKSHWLNSNNYNIRYIGKLSDTILLEQNLVPILHEEPDTSDSIYKYQKTNFEKYFLDWTDKRHFKDISQVELFIKVDTSQVIHINEKKDYPVLIQNRSADTITIGHRNIITLTTEKETKKSEWGTFENSLVFMCGVGLNSIILPPNEIAITSIRISSGNFRIKIGDNYSNEFYGAINETTFKNK